MVYDSSFKFFTEEDSVATSNSYTNVKEDGLVLQLDGDHSGATILIEGQANAQSEEWYTLSGINLNGLSVVSSLTTNGIYQFSISGLQKIRANMTAITSGSATLFGTLFREGG